MKCGLNCTKNGNACCFECAFNLDCEDYCPYFEHYLETGEEFNPYECEYREGENDD